MAKGKRQPSPPPPKKKVERDEFGFETGLWGGQTEDADLEKPAKQRYEEPPPAQIRSMGKSYTPSAAATPKSEPAPVPPSFGLLSEEPETEEPPSVTPAPQPETKPVSTMSKMDAVRAALRANPDLTASTGVPLLAKEYGVEISPNNFSTYKQVVKKEWSEGKSPAPPTSTPARVPAPSPKAAPQTSEPGGSSTLAVVRTLKSLLATYSADELKDLIDALSE